MHFAVSYCSFPSPPCPTCARQFNECLGVSNVFVAICPCTRAIDCFWNVDYQSILALTSTAYTFSGQSERNVTSAPIRTHERSSRLVGQMRILGTQPRVKPAPY